MTTELYTVRQGVKEDHPFVFATMLKGLYYGNSWFGLIPKDSFMKNYKRVVEALIYSPNTTIQVACLTEDPTVIIGYSMLSADFTTAHWVFVKKAFRGQGLINRLVPKYVTTLTHLTDDTKSLLTKYPGSVFDPFKLN